MVPSPLDRIDAVLNTHLPLTPSESAVLVVLARRCVGWGWTFSSGVIPELARQTRFSTDTVGRVLTSLEQRGVLTKTGRDVRRDVGAMSGTLGAMHLRVDFALIAGRPGWERDKPRSRAGQPATTDYAELARRRLTVDPS